MKTEVMERDPVTEGKIKISIVVPVYNVESYITDCLSSVAAQDYDSPMECLLVDDCGTDGSMALAERFIADYNGGIEFRVLRHERNRGLSAARNTGLSAATGEYVYFLDSDDTISPDCLSLLAARLREERYDFVIGGIKRVGKVGEIYPYLRLEDEASLHGKDILASYRHRQWYVMAVNKLCNIAFLKENGLEFKEGLLHEDELWSFELACTAQSMAVVNKPTYFYNIREGSIMTRTDLVKKRAETLKTIAEEMWHFSLSTGLQDNPFISDCIEAKLVGVIACGSLYHKSAFDCYKQLRKALSRAGYDRHRCNSGIHRFIRNLHHVFPTFIGYYYLRFILRIA